MTLASDSPASTSSPAARRGLARCTSCGGGLGGCASGRGHCHGAAESQAITRFYSPGSPGVTRYDSGRGARDDSTPHEEHRTRNPVTNPARPRETPLATLAPASTATPTTAATSVPRACDALAPTPTTATTSASQACDDNTLAPPYDADAPQPSNKAAPSLCDAGGVTPAPDDSAVPSLCDADNIAPVRPCDRAAPDDSTAPSSCDAGGTTPLHRAVRDDTAPPCDIEGPRQEEDTEREDTGRGGSEEATGWKDRGNGLLGGESGRGRNAGV